MKEKKYAAYIRVSTARQGESGLGIDAQRGIIESAVGKGNIQREFLEVESGKKTTRKELSSAIEYCKRSGCVLVVAKLDRLGRRAKQLWEIKESVEFLALDNRENGTLLFGILAAFAQEEGEKISERTRAALAAKKARGFKLGCPQNLTDEARRRSIASRKAKAGAKWAASKERMVALEMQRSGKSLRDIARHLNESGFRTCRGKLFQANTVKRILACSMTKEKQQ